MECTICKKELKGNQRKYCSGSCKGIAHWRAKKVQQNTYHSQTLRAFSRKLKFVEQLGGGCSKCGYSENLAVLDFHHKDPSTKSFSLDARKLSNTKESELLKELVKCELLCSNCHREEHYPEMKVLNIKKILNIGISSNGQGVKLISS